MIVCALALWLAVQGAPATAPQPERAAIEAALIRDPTTLPRAEPQHWNDWQPSDAIPEALRVDFGAALAAYQQADYGAALECCYRVLEREPDFPAALYQCGTTYFRLRRYGDCQVVMERFVATVPAEIGATQALGHCYYTLGDYARARAHYAEVVEANPQSVEAWRGFGLANLRLGETERALECLDRALQLRGDHADALIWRAQALLDLGRADEAQPCAERGCELAPYEPRGFFVLAQVLAELGRDEQAARARARFVELNRIEQEIRTQEGLLLHDPRALAPLVRLVVLQRAAGNAPEMRAALVRALRVAPDDVELRALSLELWDELGEVEFADRTAALLEGPLAQHARAWEALARHWRGRGDAARADAAELRARKLQGGAK